MVSIIIIAHGTLGESLIQCATHVLGARPERLAEVPAIGRADPDQLLLQTRGMIEKLDDGSGVLLLTDLIGGTPSNVATRALIPGRVEGIAGVSLPMLLRTLNYRELPLASVVSRAESGAHQGIHHIRPES